MDVRYTRTKQHAQQVPSNTAKLGVMRLILHGSWRIGISRCASGVEKQMTAQKADRVMNPSFGTGTTTSQCNLSRIPGIFGKNQ